MESSKKNIIKDSDFTITTTEGDSSIKTFTEVINSFSNHLQNIIRTINTFKYKHSRLQQRYDQQAKAYLTYNCFEMKLVSTKEYLQAEKELKQILQKNIKVQQQTKNGKYQQKNAKNQIILQFTQNIKNCSDLLEKSKKHISLEKTCYDIECKSKKQSKQHLDQLKEYLNFCFNSLITFLQRNQMNSQTKMKSQENKEKNQDEKSVKKALIRNQQILKNLFDFMLPQQSFKKEYKGTASTSSSKYLIQNLKFYKDLKQNIKLMLEETQKMIALQMKIEEKIKYQTFMLDCANNSQKKIEELYEYKSKSKISEQQFTNHLNQIKKQIQTLKENLQKIWSECQKQLVVIIKSTAQIDFCLQKTLIKYQNTQKIEEALSQIPLQDLINLSEKNSLIQRKIMKIHQNTQKQEAQIYKLKKQIEESMQIRCQSQEKGETHREQSTVVQCLFGKQEMKETIEIKLSENKTQMENLHKAEIDKLNNEFDAKIKELETKVTQKDFQIQELTLKINEFEEVIKSDLKNKDDLLKQEALNKEGQNKVNNFDEFAPIDIEMKKRQEDMLTSLSNQIAGKRDQWNELTTKVSKLNESVEQLKAEEESLLNSINDKKLQIEKLEQQIASKSQRISNQIDSNKQIKKSQQQQKIQCVQNPFNVNKTNSRVIGIESQQKKYQQPQFNDISLQSFTKNNLSHEPISQRLESNQSQQIKSLSSETQLQNTVTVIEEQLRSMISKTKQNWLYKHFQMGEKEEKKKKKQPELIKQKNNLMIKQSQVKQLQMINMINFMNEYIVSLTSSTYSELLIVKIQLLKLEMELKNSIQHQQNSRLTYFKEVLKLMEKMENQSFNQQNELKKKIQQLIGSQKQESQKEKIAECESKYKIVESQIEIKDKQINELNQQLKNTSQSLKTESQKLKTLNTELDNKKQEIYQIQNKIQKNSFDSNRRFKQEKENLEGSIKQKDYKINDLQYELQTQKLKITSLQKQYQKLKNNNNDTNIDLSAALQQNDKLKRSLQDTKRELNTIKNSVTFKESELNKLKQQINNLNSTIQSLQQQISDKQVTIAQQNQQLSTKNQQLNTLNYSINQIKSQSTQKITSLTKQLSTSTSRLQDIQSNFNKQKQFKTDDFTQTNYQIQKLHQQLKRFLQISDIHKREQQTNQSTIKSLTQTNQSNTQTINLLQNENLSLQQEIQSLQQSNTQISAQNNKDKQIITQLTTLKEEKQKQINAQTIKNKEIQEKTKNDLIKITSLQKDKQNLATQLKKLIQNITEIKKQNQKKLNQLNLQSNHFSTQFEYQKGKNQANQKQITELKESVKELTEQKTKHHLENCQMKMKIQNLEKEEKQLKQNLRKKENEFVANMIDFDEKLSKQQKLNAENLRKINALIEQVTQQKTMIEVRDSQIKGLKENCKLMGNHIITLQKVQTQKEKLDVHVIGLSKKIQDLQQQCDKYSRQITQISESNSQLQTKLYAKIQRLKEREILMKDSFEIQKSQFGKCLKELKTQILQKDDKIKTLSAKILSEEDEIGKLQKQVQSSKSNEADLLSLLQKTKCQRQAISIQNFKKFKQEKDKKDKHIQDVQDQLAAAKFRITRLESRLKDNPLKVSQFIQIEKNQKQQQAIQ